MKKKFRKQFHKQFPWYDQEYLLDAMILWTENASKMHNKHGNFVRSNDIVYLDYKYQDACRKYDKEYCFGLIAKHLDTFWD